MRAQKKMVLTRVYTEREEEVWAFLTRRCMSIGAVLNKNLFPPRNVLNGFLGCGIDDLKEGSAERGVMWRSISVTAEEYADLLSMAVTEYGVSESDPLTCEEHWEEGQWEEWFSRRLS